MRLYSQKPALSFDDILLVPQYSEIKSRLHTDVKTKLSRNVELDIPIISSNMSTVTEWRMLVAMDKLGGIGCLHRFISIEEQIKQVKKAKLFGCSKFVVSIGVKDHDYREAASIAEENPSAFLLDIAMGDSKHCYEMQLFYGPS